MHSQDPLCPSGTGPCNISKAFDVGPGCTLDFGARAVTITASGKIDIFSNTVTILAGSFTVAPGGRVEGRGNLATAPRDRGGSLTITTTGAIDIQRSGTPRGVVDLSGNTRGGTFLANAGGPITVSGDLVSNGLTISGGNGSISLRSGGDITTSLTANIAATGGDFSSGGFIDVVAKGRVDLGTILVANGGDGGVIDVQSGGEAIVRGINANGSGDAGSGGCASVFAGTRVQMLAPVLLTGTGSPTLSGGGCGGFIDIDARFGDVTINAPITADSGAPDGGGGGIGIVARGSITHADTAPLSVQGQGPQSCGGEIALEADLDVTSNGSMDASGGFGGNLVDVIAGRNIVMNGMADAQGRDTGGFGGGITVIGGDRGSGNVTINSALNSDGGACGTLNGCGLGGFNEVSGCNVTIASTASVLARGADGGDNLLTAREKLTVQGFVNATTTLGMTNGANTFQHPSRVPATIVAANVDPMATITQLATCTAFPPVNCLIPCPTCGNGMVEFPETCDTSGTPVNCDGCTTFCRVENCNDTNTCTTDSCDPGLGCRNAPVTDGTSCTDSNVCNGVDTCAFGICRSSGALNCNDLNVCTTDSCNPILGCQNPAAPVTTPCADGNACTSFDHCDGAKACIGTPACGTTTTTSVPTPTTSSSSLPPPTTTTSSLPPPTTSTSVPTPTTSSTTSSTSSTSSTTAPTPTTSSTSVPTATTSSTSVPTATTSSTSVPTATTSSTSVPTPTTSSTSVPGATTTSTSVPGASTTSTTTTTPATTSTSLPTGCVPADCSDANTCTTDVCQAGTCVHRHEGFTSVECEIGKLQTSTNLCAPDPIYTKLATSITLKSQKARNLVTKAKTNTKNVQALLNRAAKQLTGLRNRITKAGDKGKITAACSARLDALLAERLALVQGLATP